MLTECKICDKISYSNVHQFANNNSASKFFKENCKCLKIVTSATSSSSNRHLVIHNKLVKINQATGFNKNATLLATTTQSPIVCLQLNSSEFELNRLDKLLVLEDGKSDSEAQQLDGAVIAFMCQPCRMFFPVEHMLAAHNKNVHGQSMTIIKTRKKSLSCKECDQIFPSEEQLVSHRLTHDSLKQHDYLKCQSPPLPRQTTSQAKITTKRCLTIDGTIQEKLTMKSKSLSEEANSSFQKSAKDEYSCNNCDFKSITRSEIVAHVTRWHGVPGIKNESTLLEHTLNEDEDEASWPLESAEESKLELNETVEEFANRSFSCSHCPYQTNKPSTFYSHVKRKHQKTWHTTEPIQLGAEQFKIEDEDKQRSPKKYKLEGLVTLMDPLKNEPILEEKVLAVESESEITELYKCALCPFVTKLPAALDSHLSRVHPGESPKSQVVKRRKPRKRNSQPVENLSIQSNPQKYTGYACRYCTFVAATVVSLKSHNAREHSAVKPPIEEVPVTEYDCHQCEYKSKNRKNMQLHLKIHTAKANADGMYTCNVCLYETTSKMGLQRHISIKHNKPRREAAKIDPKANYECEQCDFKCRNGKMMEWHLKQHGDSADGDEDAGTIYFCNDCDFSTWTKGQLSLHIKRKHRDDGVDGAEQQQQLQQAEDGYPCAHCDYVSKSKHSLKIHVIRKHTSAFNHQCDICGKKYKVKADLTNHIRFQHREQPIICDVCGKTCRNSNLLYLHQKFAHYKPDFECHICHRRMVSQANLDEHIFKQHEQRQDAVCDECGKTFTKQARLKIHKRVHTGLKPYTCKVCAKAFARRNGLRQHLLIHTGQRPYVCDICGKAFTQKTGLISHRKSHPGSHPPLPRVTIDHVLSDLLHDRAEGCSSVS